MNGQLMITRTSTPQSIGAVLDSMKHNALQAVKQTIQEGQLQSVPLGGDVRMGWTDEDGRTRSGTLTGLDEQQLPCGSHIWLMQLNDALQNTLARQRQTA